MEAGNREALDAVSFQNVEYKGLVDFVPQLSPTPGGHHSSPESANYFNLQERPGALVSV